MSDRGMKKWLPYKSLTEQGGYLSEIIARKSVEEQPIPMEDEAEKIDSFLRNYAGGEIELCLRARPSLQRYSHKSRFPEKADCLRLFRGSLCRHRRNRRKRKFRHFPIKRQSPFLIG